MNDHVLLNISTVTGKWFRKFVFNFNLTGVYHLDVAVLWKVYYCICIQISSSVKKAKYVFYRTE